MSIICFLKGAWNDIRLNTAFHVIGHDLVQQEDDTLMCERCGYKSNVKVSV